MFLKEGKESNELKTKTNHWTNIIFDGKISLSGVYIFNRGMALAWDSNIQMLLKKMASPPETQLCISDFLFTLLQVLANSFLMDIGFLLLLFLLN